MTRKLKVFGWRFFRRGAQTREIMAAPTIKAVREAAGLSRRDWEFSGCETGNKEEVEQAMGTPGVVFYREINARDGSEWTTLEDSSNE